MYHLWIPRLVAGCSSGKESVCNAGDPGLIPGLERSPGEGIGYSLQYSWAPLVAQMVKNPPVMWETCIWSLDWEDALEEGMETHSNILAWRTPWMEKPGGLQSMESQRVRHKWAANTKPSCLETFWMISGWCHLPKGVRNNKHLNNFSRFIFMISIFITM